MRPTHLTTRGLKSWKDLELELAPLMAIQGPNGSGKSAILEAIRLALIGYDPGTGKQLQATRKLVDEVAGEAEVGLSFDTGFAIRRRFSDKSDIQVMPSQGEASGRDCQARIDEETGGMVVYLDLNGEFLQLSDEKRREWLFKHLPRESARLDRETFDLWTNAAKSDLGHVVQNLWTHSVQAAPNPVIGLGNAIEVANRDFLEADGQRQTQSKVLARVEEQLRGVQAPDAVADEEYSEVEQRLASLNQRIGEARAGREGAAAIQARVTRFTAEVERAQRELEHTERVRADLAEQLAAAPTEFEDLTNLGGQLGGLEADVQRLGRQHADAQQRLEDARLNVRELVGRQKQVSQHGACPFVEFGCATDTGALLEAVLQEIQTELEEAEAVVDTEQLAVTTANTELQEARGELEGIRQRIRANQEAVGELTGLRRNVADQDTRLKELRERVELSTAELKQAQTEAAALGDDEALCSLYSEREEVEAAGRELAARRDAIVKHATRLEQQDKERAELERVQAKAGALGELVGNLQRLRAHVIETMIEPLQESAQAVLSAMDREKTFRFIFERENRAIMDFGFEQDGVLRLFDAASKGERVMLVVSFLVALLATRAPRMKLLVIDDAEQLDAGRRRRLMEALAGLQELLDCVVIAGACDFGSVDGWVTEVLGEVEIAEVAVA